MIFTYENFALVFQTINAFLKLDGILVAVRLLALSFILVNIIKQLFDSKGDDGKPLTTKQILSTFAYMGIIIFQPTLFNFLELLVGSYSEYLINATNTIKPEDTLQGHFASANLNFSFDGAMGWVLSSACIAILDFIAWIMNATAFPMYMLERGFILLILNLLLPFILAISALEKFRDLVWNWIRLYMAVIFMGPLFCLVGSVIDLCYSLFLTILQDRIKEFFDEVGAESIKVALVAVCVFSKVRLLSAAVSISYKLFKV